MTLLANSTAIIPVSSQHGFDGSNTIPSIDEGYCIDLENADLSEAGVIRKRPGHCPYHSDFPCKMIYETRLAVGGYSLAYDKINFRSLTVRVTVLNAAGLAFLDSKFGYQTNRVADSKYAIAEILNSLDGGYAGMIEDNEILWDNTTMASTKSWKPIKILSPSIFIIPAGILPAANVSVYAHPGCCLPKLKRITNVEIVSVAPGTNNAYKVYTVEYVHSIGYYWCPVQGKMTFSSKVNGEYVIFIPAVMSSRPDFVKDALYFVAPIISRTSDADVTTAATVYPDSVEAEDRITYSTIAAGTYYVKGIGAEVIPTALESFYQLLEERDKLVTCVDGNLYKEPSTFFTTTQYSITPPSALTGQTLTKSLGVYFITYAGANTVYLVGDKVFIQRQNSDTQAITVYQMLVSAVTTAGVYVTGDAPATVSTGEVLHFTRYTNTITISGSGFPTGMIIYVDGITPYRVSYCDAGVLGFDYPISISSNSLIYVCNPWEVVEAYSTKIRLDQVSGNVTKIKPSTKYSFGAYIGDDKGIVRYDGNIPFNLSLPGPKVIGARSIPGTKGTFPIAVSANNQKIGQPVRAVFTYVFYDVNGMRIETENTVLGDGSITPNAAGDGSDYAELVEYKISYPPLVPAGYQVFVHAYVSTINTEVNVEQDFFLYRIIRIFPNAADVTRDVYSPISVIVGDIPGSALASAPVLSSIGNPILVPPRAKHLATIAGRLLAANLTSFPYVKYKPLRVFDDANRFAAYLYIKVSEDNGTTYKEYYTAPVGMVANGTSQQANTSDVNATTTVLGGTDNNYPATFPGYLVNALEYGNAEVGVGAATVAYTNTANIFKSADYTAPATFTAGTTRVVMRKGSRQVNIKGLPIKFETEVFTVSKPAADIIYNATSYWTDPTFGTDGVPEAIKGTGFAVFENVPAIGGKFLRSNLDGVYISCGTNTANPELVLSFYEDVFPKATWNASIDTKYLVLHGVGTYISVTSTQGDEVLSFDEDLVWYCVFTDTVAIVLSGGGTRTINNYRITPFLVKGAGATASFDAVTIGTVSGGNTLDNRDITIEVFRALNTATAVDSYVAALKDFTIPPDYVTVAKAGIGGAGGIFAVGDYLTFELLNLDRQKLSANFPRLSGVSWVVTASAAGTITVKSISTRAIKPGGISESVVLNALSYVVNTKKMFTVGLTGNVPYLTTYLTAGVGLYGRGSYLLVRGYDNDSVCLELSGPIDEITGIATNKIIIPIPKPWLTTGTATETYAIDYRKITGVMNSCVIRSFPLVYGRYPIPVPRRLSTNSEFYDLALPVYSQNQYISDNTYVQITKRFLHAIRKSTNVPSLSTTENISVGEFVVYSTDGENNFVTVSAVGGPGYWEIQGIDNTTLLPVTVKPVYNTNYTLYGREDNRGSSLIWTDTVSASNAILGSLPTFRKDFYKEINAEDDSEITGMAAFQNAGIITKKNSIWRVTFDESGKIAAQRIQSPTGSVGGNNLPTTISYCYFMNASGVYFTDGSTTEQVFKLNRFFNENVDTSERMLKRCAGYTDAERKIVHLGAPYYSKYVDNTGNVNGQFDYCYNDGVFGWSANIGIPALKFVTANREIFFINAEGGVSKIRNEDSLSRFRDGNGPIDFNLKTRYLDAEELQKYKFLRNVLFAFGDYSTFNAETYYTIDFKSAEYPLEIYNQTGASFYKGTVTQGNTQLLKQLRETIAQRVFTISFRLAESTVDTDFPIYRISVEGWLGNSRLVSQKGGTRT
jgi:hypothetical protein